MGPAARPGFWKTPTGLVPPSSTCGKRHAFYVCLFTHGALLCMLLSACSVPALPGGPRGGSSNSGRARGCGGDGSDCRVCLYDRLPGGTRCVPRQSAWLFDLVSAE
eukprot:3933369-Pyramimonas_sp.AAC.2